MAHLGPRADSQELGQFEREADLAIRAKTGVWRL